MGEAPDDRRDDEQDDGAAKEDMDIDQAHFLGLAADMGHEFAHGILGRDEKKNQPVEDFGGLVIAFWVIALWSGERHGLVFPVIQNRSKHPLHGTGRARKRAGALFLDYILV